jgi:hypothetical protein
MISIHPPLFHLFRDEETTRIDWENSLRSENRISIILGIFLHTFFNDVGFLSFFIHTLNIVSTTPFVLLLSI